MKKILLILFVILSITIFGCSEQKSNSEYENKVEKTIYEEVVITDSILVAGSFFVTDSKNITFLKDSMKRNDIEYLKQLILENKVFYVDRDTSVKCFGEISNKDEVLITFNEGRYTNKQGYTFGYNVFSKDTYSIIQLVNKEQDPLQLIQISLLSTNNFFDLIKYEDVDGMNKMKNLCELLGKKLREKANNSSIKECMMEAREIILYRGAAIVGGLDVVKYSENDRQHKISVETTYELVKDALKLNKIFKDNYGF